MIVFNMRAGDLVCSPYMNAPLSPLLSCSDSYVSDLQQCLPRQRAAADLRHEELPALGGGAGLGGGERGA